MSAIRNINNVKELDTLYEQSQATIIGAGGDLNEWLNGINDWLKENDFGHIDELVTYKGKDVNEHFNLEGNNRFQDDLTFISWSHDSINKENYGKYCLARLEMGIRWFDDIIDNSRPQNDEED